LHPSFLLEAPRLAASGLSIAGIRNARYSKFSPRTRGRLPFAHSLTAAAFPRLPTRSRLPALPHLPARIRVSWLVPLLLLALLASGAASGAPGLRADTELSREGYFVLSWEGGAGETWLQQAEDPAFAAASSVRVEGAGSLTLTGFRDGLYHFRVGSERQDWSETVSIEVSHHGMGRAWAFFSLGLVLFLALCAAILLGNRRARRRNER
jgi:hypothetical protein